MKKLLVLLMLPVIANAAVITGNMGNWSGWEGEWFVLGALPIFQGVTIPDPGPGLLWDVDSLSFQAIWAGDGGQATGFRAWLLPGTISNGQPYSQNWPAQTVAYFEYHHGGLIPAGIANAISVTTANISANLVGAGNYYLEMRPLAGEEWVAPVAFGRDGGANSYPGGAEGYFQEGSGTIGVNASWDIVFALDGSAVPEPATLILLSGGLMILRRRHRR